LTRTAHWLLPLALAAVVGPAARGAPAKEEPISVQAIPGGVTDAAGAKGFVVNAERGIDAIDLESGKTLWTYKDGGQPLAVVGDRLLVKVIDAKKSNAARMLALDLAEGKNVWQSDPLVFPDWVTPGPTGQWSGRSFAAQPVIEKGELWLRWKAHAFYAGGAAPTPEILKASQKDVAGAARVNLESGKVEMLSADKAPPAPEVKVSDEVRKAAGRQVFNGSEMELTVTTAGDYAVAVDVEPHGATDRVVLKRWDLKTARALDPAMLAEGVGFLTSMAAGAVLVRSAPAAKSGEDAPPWTVTVYSLETAKEKAKFTAEDGTTEATIIGPRAYYVVQTPLKGGLNVVGDTTQPRTLKAVDLKSGKFLWQHPLECATYSSPPP